MAEIIRMDHPRVARIIAQKQAQDSQARQYRLNGRTYRVVSPVVGGSFTDRFPDGAWRGQPCFIIGGGPSLKGFDFERLRGRRTIAINKAFYDAPFADIVFSMDRPLIDSLMSGQLGENYRRAFALFEGAKLWLDLSGHNYPADVYHLPAAGETGWTKSLSEGLFYGPGGLSGYGALNLAMVLGADPIYLLGYDCALGPAGESNYHSGYPSGSNPDAMNIFRKALEAGAALLNGRPRIVNLNPQSALRSFEFGNVDAVLAPGEAVRSDLGYVIVSFYTLGTSYAKEIRGLERSLQEFRIPHHFFAFEPTGTWRGNLNFKSACILKAFGLFPGKDIVFLDSDAIVRRHPALFDELSAKHEYDLSAHFFKYDPKSGDADELLSGTLWIQNNAAGRFLVERWHAIGLQHPELRHQMCLKVAVEALAREGRPVRVNRHPFAYTCIFDYQAAQDVVPIIEHFQASRRFRKEVGYGQDLVAGGRA